MLMDERWKSLCMEVALYSISQIATKAHFDSDPVDVAQFMLAAAEVILTLSQSDASPDQDKIDKMTEAMLIAFGGCGGTSYPIEVLLGAVNAQD